MFLALLHRLVYRKTPVPSAEKKSFVPRVLVLEDRTLPSTFTVLNLNDHGNGSLRQAILSANLNPGADVIQFRSGLSGKITLTSGPLSVASSLSVAGPGTSKLSIDGNHASRIFTILGGNVTLSGLTITNGLAPRGGG